MLNALGDAVSWAVSELGAPILTGALAGLAVWFAQRWDAVSSEVERHDRRVEELNEDLQRFLRDLDRQFKQEVSRLRGETLYDRLLTGGGTREGKTRVVGTGEIRAAEGRLVAKRNEVKEQMRSALWSWRDEASRKRREFVGIARSEARRHDRYRARKKLGHPALHLPSDRVEILAGWKEKPDPFESGAPALHVEDDPTHPTHEPALAAMEAETGVTWEAARTGRAAGRRLRERIGKEPDKQPKTPRDPRDPTQPETGARPDDEG